jgi:hypothetical protein
MKSAKGSVQVPYGIGRDADGSPSAKKLSAFSHDRAKQAKLFHWLVDIGFKGGGII